MQNSERTMAASYQYQHNLLLSEINALCSKRDDLKNQEQNLGRLLRWNLSRTTDASKKESDKLSMETRIQTVQQELARIENQILIKQTTRRALEASFHRG